MQKMNTCWMFCVNNSLCITNMNAIEFDLKRRKLQKLMAWDWIPNLLKTVGAQTRYICLTSSQQHILDGSTTSAFMNFFTVGNINRIRINIKNLRKYSAKGLQCAWFSKMMCSLVFSAIWFAIYHPPIFLCSPVSHISSRNRRLK